MNKYYIDVIKGEAVIVMMPNKGKTGMETLISLYEEVQKDLIQIIEDNPNINELIVATMFANKEKPMIDPFDNVVIYLAIPIQDMMRNIDEDLSMQVEALDPTNTELFALVLELAIDNFTKEDIEHVVDSPLKEVILAGREDKIKRAH